MEGRELANEVYPMNVDQLFTLLFTNSKFYMDFHANRKTFGKAINVKGYIQTVPKKANFCPKILSMVKNTIFTEFTFSKSRFH